MPRRLVLAAVASALTLGAVPATAAPGCVVTFADPLGDAAAPSHALYRPPATPGVDIEQVTVDSGRGRLTVAVTVDDIALQPVSTGTRVAFEFVLRQWVFQVFHVVQPVPDAVASRVDWTHGIELYDEVVSDAVDVSVAGDTVTMSVTLAELERIRRKPVAGQRISGLDATTTSLFGPDLRVVPHPRQQLDRTESATGASRVLGTSCR